MVGIVGKTDVVCKYTISVKTGFRFGGWTNCNLYITLCGKNEKSEKITLSGEYIYPFRRSYVATFPCSSVINIDDEPKISLSRDGGLLSCWYINWITIKNCTTDNTYIYLVNEWVKRDCDINLVKIGTSLPQKDTHGTVRSEILANLRTKYQLEMKDIGLPPQVKKLPVDEEFSLQNFATLLIGEFFNGKEKKEILKNKKWTTFKDGMSVYSGVYDIPPSARHKDRFSDERFGRQRLQGLNPSLLVKCTEVPNILKKNMNSDLMKITEDLIRKEQLFLVDLEILSKCKPIHGRVMTCPIALFSFENKKDLMPIAIQLFQNNEQNTVFCPLDGEYMWLLAKMWFNLADATYHQALTHLNFTHLMMEGVGVTSKRQLAPSHPIMKLLNPHFLYIMAINSLALTQLTSVDGFINKTSNAGINGHFDLMKNSMGWWTFKTHANLRENLKMRKVDDKEVLENAYHFRDDALLLYNTIEKYVKEYVELYYKENKDLTEDRELEAWGKELVLSREEGGLGMVGVPNAGLFDNQDVLIDTLTPIIYTCSVGHAAANFQQYNEYADPINYPYSLLGSPPTNKTENITEEKIMSTIAKKDTLLDLMAITRILSQRSTNVLGNFEQSLIVDPPAVEIVNRFRQQLVEDGKTIENRNKNRTHPYEWLHPGKIPNAISI